MHAQLVFYIDNFIMKKGQLFPPWLEETLLLEISIATTLAYL
jgi:hypothetical protein